jgi:hypothetical protein
MEEVNGKIMQQGFLESYFQMARKDLNQKAKDAQGEIRGLKSENRAVRGSDEADAEGYGSVGIG